MIIDVRMRVDGGPVLELRADYTQLEVSEFYHPLPPSELYGAYEIKKYDGQMVRHRDFVEMISKQIAMGLARVMTPRC
jgi:hypothetical protein